MIRGFKYILFALALVVSVGARGQYNPANPAEPGAPVTSYVLTLQADPSGGGSFNLNQTTSYAAGTVVNLRAYTASNFAFVAWEEDGVEISTAANFNYTMPAHDARLIAHYIYNPSGPAEPAQPVMPVKPVYSNIYLTASPAAGGSFNIASGNSYEVGTTVQLKATPASNFKFVNWVQDDEVVSESATYNYIMLEGADANRLTANFIYVPSSPGEPAEPSPKKIYHRVYLQCDPAGGGYFNADSGNQYEEGTAQSFRAYNNEWYTFQNWTIDGEIVSTNSTYSLTIPTEDVTLTAHYTYNYNPSNPSEPSASTTKRLNIYGMTASGALGQNVIYPVLLENTEEVYGVTVVVHFPTDFKVLTGNVMLGERAAGHTMTVTPLEGNAYRFDLEGDALIAGNNGKIFEVPVTISDVVAVDSSYAVSLTNGARLNLDGSKEVISTRNGYIYVEDVKEDGLYAQFSYDKLQSRVKFTNLSSDKAIACTWDFGDGTSSTEHSPLHIYAAPGYYDVRLIAKGQTGTDVAVMTVLINDENTWNVQGAFFLDTELKGVRYFTAADDLFAFLAAKPMTGDVRISVKAGTTFDYALTDEHIACLATIQQHLAEGGYTLTLLRGGDAAKPKLQFGTSADAIDEQVVSLFTQLGASLVCEDVELRLMGVDFNTAHLRLLAGQTVFSGQATEEVDFSLLSSTLQFSWAIASAPETAEAYPAEGTGNIPSMTATSGNANDCDLVYNIIGSRAGEKFIELTHTITLRPALEGKFTDLRPVNGTELETTTVNLTWNAIKNAVYDVYLWNAANEQPTTPVAEGITELSFLSQNFCQNGRTYNWYVVARNAVQRMESDVMSFAVNILPDLHVTALTATDELEAGQTVTIQWKVRNDGAGATGTQGWTDRIWLVPDVYSGTAATKCVLVASQKNVAALAPGEEYTATAEVTLDEASYGSYYLLAAADMSSVTLIDWTPAGGTIANPYTPVATVPDGSAVGTYPYLFATTAAAGNQLREHGEANNRSDNFFYTKVEIAMPQMDEADWQLLQDAYTDMKNGNGWTSTWNFDVERRTVLTLPGVSILGGRVVSIDLHSNGITGAFPARLLTLPALRTLNLSKNKMSGDVAKAVAAMAKGDAALGPALESLNISSNRLTGNIGQVAAELPHLTSLNASSNRLSEVNPMIATSVTSLNLGKQTISKTVTLDLTNLSPSALMAQIPSILTYSHSAQSYDNALNLLISTGYDEWAMQLSCTNEAIGFPYVAAQNDYHGANGDTLSVAVTDSQRRPEGSTLKLKLMFAEGDANFNGSVDVTDLQAQINFAFEDYADKPFNFTAANLWTDDLINVQDVVGMVNILLSLDAEAQAAPSAAKGSVGGGTSATTPASSPSPAPARTAPSDQPLASLFVSQGQVWIETSTPVASFELSLTSSGSINCSEELKSMGFTVRSNSVGNRTRVVGYSLSGATLPVGRTPLCDINHGSATITAGVLSDSDAEPVGFEITDIATGIDESIKTADNNSPDTECFDLSGRRITGSTHPSMRKGIYIQRGRKVVK